MRSIAFALVLVATVAMAAVPWYVSYEEGLAAFKDGDHAAARAHFEAALATRAEEGLHVPTEGLHSVDYLPHLYLAIACYHTGDVEAARRQFEAADSSAVAAQSGTGKALLDHYRTLLFPAAGGAVVVPPPPAPVSAVPSVELDTLRATERGSVVLSDEEVARVAQNTLTRCGLSPNTATGSAPWYFHYEMGQRMAENGDPQRAVDFLIAAASRKPLPDSSARMYGMWFVAYLPYLEIAANHVMLGNWGCAFSALKLSEETGEVDESHVNETFERHRSLLDEVEAQLEARQGQEEE